MSKERDSIHHQQLARQARRIAAEHSDPLVARRLREEAVKHDRLAKRLAREEGEQGRVKPQPLTLGARLRRTIERFQ